MTSVCCAGAPLTSVPCPSGPRAGQEEEENPIALHNYTVATVYGDTCLSQLLVIQ